MLPTHHNALVAILARIRDPWFSAAPIMLLVVLGVVAVMVIIADVPHHKWRFSLRMLLFVMTLVAILLGWIGYAARN